MAMRPKPRAQSSIRPVYEIFKANSDMKEKEDAYFLHIYLPGFIKEGIKINFVSSSRMVRVVGERPLNYGNRISRFEQTYPVPDDCDVQKLQGKYEQGTLTITMPKKPIPQVDTPKTEIEPTKRKGPTPISPLRKPMPQPKPKEEPKQAIPPKSPITRIEPKVEPIQDYKRPQNVQEEKSTTIASTSKDQMGRSQKGQEEIETKPTSSIMDPSKQIEDKREEEIKQAISYIENFKKKLSEMDEKRGAIKKKDETGKPEKYIDHNMILEDKEIKARKSPKEGESSSPKAQEKGKESNIDKRKNKDDSSYTIGKGINEVVASATEVVTRIGEGTLNEEEKPLVANMGAAILVIVALGAYVTYKFTSSGRP
ncbi:hypothetical protein VNO77_25864 [Canavalia gladiata]|uniref:SHSP domain-containing protein n=1 Tax=Canavalia gladiata TaxID=3824 RepID=A0AAN9KUA2_CANGL